MNRLSFTFTVAAYASRSIKAVPINKFHFDMDNIVGVIQLLRLCWRKQQQRIPKITWNIWNGNSSLAESHEQQHAYLRVDFSVAIKKSSCLTLFSDKTISIPRITFGCFSALNVYRRMFRSRYQWGNVGVCIYLRCLAKDLLFLFLSAHPERKQQHYIFYSDPIVISWHYFCACQNDVRPQPLWFFLFYALCFFVCFSSFL